MAAENKPKSGGNSKNFGGKKRKQFLPYNKPVKKKGTYPLRPGVQGFFITCDGGRERQAAHEALFVIDSVCIFIVFSIWVFFILFFLLSSPVFQQYDTSPVTLLHIICDI